MAKAKKPPEATEEAIDVSQPSIALASPVLGVMGSVANGAEQIGLALQRSGAHVGLQREYAGIAYEQVHQVFTGGFTPSEDAPPPCAMLSFFEPGSRVAAWRRGQRLFGVVTASYPEMPAAWETGLSQAEAIFAPSEWTAEVVQRATQRPVELARFGVDASTFTYAERKRGDKLRILFFARRALDGRKGLDTALAAFAAAFPQRDDVELTVRSTEQHVRDHPDPRIKFAFGPLAPAALADMYRSFDALLHTSRAEAFGAVPLEAMATGMPAIHSGATGMSAYADLGLTVPTRAMRSQFGEWREPYLDMLVDRLQQVDREYDAVQVKAREDAQAVASRFSWDATAASILRTILGGSK